MIKWLIVPICHFITYFINLGNKFIYPHNSLIN